MTDARPDLRFPSQFKLKARADFAAVYDTKQRAGDQLLLVFGRRNRLPVSRCGLSVSRKNGGAVQRNRIKRRLREAFRHLRSELPPGLDLILIPRVGTAATPDEYQRSLRSLVKRIVRHLPSDIPPPEPQPGTDSPARSASE